MKIQINIEKKHVFLILSFVLLVGIVIAYGGNQPNVMGHSDGEIRLPALNQNLDVWSGSINTQVVNHASRIGTIETSYCQLSNPGACPASSPPQYIAYSVPDNVACPAGTTGLICVKLGLPLAGFSQSNSYHPYWISGQWRSSTSGSQGGCSRVICG